MTALMSEGSRKDEILHIREDVEGRYADLKKRKGRWVSITSSLSGGSLFLIVGGLLMLVLGQLPDSIELVSPVVETAGPSTSASPNGANAELDEIYQTMKGVVGGTFGKFISMTMIVMGIILGIARQNIMSMTAGLAAGIGLYSAPEVLEAILGIPEYHAEPAPFAVIQTQFEDAIDSGDWPRAWELLEPISASESDMAMLKSQVAYQAGDKQKSIRIIDTNHLATAYPEEVWMIESRFIQENISDHYQMSDESLQFAEDQADRRSQGWSMLRTSIPFGILAFGAGIVTLTLRRNVRVINEWITPELPEGKWTPMVNKLGEPVDPTSIATGNQKAR